ncbi:MAG: 2-hydroxyacid dehydrogenase [Terriglobia bacterium]|jgi:phosphoglycerate dehydrogenase-like enzyme
MAQRQKHRPLNVILWGRQAALGKQLLKEHVHAPCRFYAFPEPPTDLTPPRELVGADVVVGSFITEPMARAANQLKLLQAVGAGLDGFPLKALSPKTSVANASFHGPAIGEYVMMMVLALSRELLKMDSFFRCNVWYGSWIWGIPPAAEIQGKVLGLVGYGTIGKEVAARARAFGMKLWVVSAHPPARKPRNVEFWGTPRQLSLLLKNADYVVLACPLNEQTRGLMGKKEFAGMKPTASLINVARGPVIDEEALYQALHARRIQSAAIDVWYQYPTSESPQAPSRFPFHKLDNIIMTPHVSGWMQGTRENRFKLIAENIDRLAAGKPLRNVVQGPHRQRPNALTRPS